MALIMPCTFCTSLQRRNFPINLQYSPNFRRGATTTTCEFRIPVEVSTPSDRGSLAVPSHKVTVHDRQRGVVHEFEVPEDQYILHSAESQNITLPFACRHGCCTSCAVRVKSGELRQPQALGISAELKSQVISLFLRLARDTSGLELRRQFVMVRVCVCEKLGPTLIESTEQCKALNNYSIVRGYALLCVGFPTSDLEVETQDEDEVYWLQFGRYFARGPIERDDYALELAMGDE